MAAGRRYKNKPRCTLRYNGAEYIVQAGAGHRFFRMQKRSLGMQLSYPGEGFHTKSSSGVSRFKGPITSNRAFFMHSGLPK